MIPQKPPPRLENENKFSDRFRQFISRCLIKDPAKRPGAAELLSDPFLVDSKASDDCLKEITVQAQQLIASGALIEDQVRFI